MNHPARRISETFQVRYWRVSDRNRNCEHCRNKDSKITWKFQGWNSMEIRLPNGNKRRPTDRDVTTDFFPKGRIFVIFMTTDGLMQMKSVKSNIGIFYNVELN